MNGLIVLLLVILFQLLIIISGQPLYRLEMKIKTRKLTHLLGLDVLQLDYSFDQIVYFVSLPSNIESIRNARSEDIVIKLDYRSVYFPKLEGLKIYIKTEGKRVLLAYLPIRDFRIPVLDRLEEEGRISTSDYLKLSICKLTHERTLQQITDEVYRQIQVGRSGQIKKES